MPKEAPVADITDPNFVVAVARATGQKQRIPREWLALSDAGVPGFDFELPPSERGESPKPTLSKSVKESSDAS